MNLLERDNVIVGFRPEHFLPKDVLGESSRFITYEFEVTRVEYLGADRLAYGVIHGAAGPTRIISRIPSTIPTHIEAGKAYEFEVDRSRLRYFDKESGLRTEPREEAALVG